MALVPVAEALERLLDDAGPLPGESIPLAEAKLLMVRVSAERKPERCVPPSTVLMVLAKAKTFSP